MISACLVVKNEEKWLSECLDHLKPVIREFIVVDTGSTDRSLEIAREKGARVFQIPWENDFAKARNFSLQKATQRWILVVDPDERLSEADLLKIRHLVEAPGVMAYAFQTRNYSQNTLASGFVPCKGEYPDQEKDYPGYFESKKIRLFQNIPTTRFVGSVHELVESTIKGKVVDSAIPFHHYGSTSEVMVEKSKDVFYQAQTEKKARENPHDWKAHFELGIEWLTAKEHLKAYKELEKARKLKPRDLMVLANLGYAYMESGKLSEAEMILKEALQYNPDYHDALLNLGVVYMRKENWLEGIKFFDRLLEKHPNSFLALRNRGLCYAYLRKFQFAAQSLERALRLFPQYVDAKIDLGIVCQAAGRPDLAKPLLEESLKENPHSLRARASLDEVEKSLLKIQK